MNTTKMLNRNECIGVYYKNENNTIRLHVYDCPEIHLYTRVKSCAARECVAFNVKFK